MVGAWIGIFLGLNVAFNVLCKPLQEPLQPFYWVEQSDTPSTVVFPTVQLQTGLDPQN